MVSLLLVFQNFGPRWPYHEVWHSLFPYNWAHLLASTLSGSIWSSLGKAIVDPHNKLSSFLLI